MMPASDSQASLMKKALAELKRLRTELSVMKRAAREPIAIIGMGCRFPGGANDPERFWELLRDGRDAIGEVPPDRWNVEDYYDPDPDAPGKMYTSSGGFLRSVDTFDARFFDIAPREAASLDPQQRMILEVSWEALENANLPAQRLYGSRTGVFVGIGSFDYVTLQARTTDLREISPYFATGGSLCVAAGRVSHLLGLTGPCFSMDTACSSSLVAIHQAIESLRRKECDMALAGGVNALLAPEVFVNFCKARMLSPEGRCKTFDASANGYVRGEGCGMILLKRLSDATADGDPVQALIRGSAINQDGASGGLTVPSGPSQETVIHQALARGAVAPDQVDYVEAHGTGTSLGDPIEMGSIVNVFGKRHRPLIVGSVKTNIGHLEPAAGISGLIKVVLALKHKKIPPNLHLHTPNPKIPWKEIPVKIPTALMPWPSNGGPRMGGVNSFGFSGTNAHVLLEEAPVDEAVQGPPSTDRRSVQVLTLSAKTQDALTGMVDRYERHLKQHPSLAPADICFSAGTGRSHFRHRLAVISDSIAGHRQGLTAYTAGQTGEDVIAGKADGRPQPVFLFTGQGAQYTGMGRQLFETHPVFRENLQRCNEILESYLEKPLLDALYPAEGSRGPGLADDSVYAQPALFALEYSLAELWSFWGIRPSAVMGVGVGEYAAACVAGIFSIEDGLKLVATQAMPTRSMPQKASMADDFRHVLGDIRFSQPRIHFISSVTGEEAAGELMNPEYWAAHHQRPVKFAAGMKALFELGLDVFVEMGPKPVLLEMGRALLPDGRGVWLPALQPGQTGRCTLRSLGELYVLGAPVDWSGVYQADASRHVVLPTYPFQRKRYWIESIQLRNASDSDPSRRGLPHGPIHPLLGPRLPSALESVLFESRISPNAPRFLDHHRVHGKGVVPAAAFLEMALAAGEAVIETDHLVMQDVVIQQALILPEAEPVIVQTIVTEEMGGRHSFRIFSLSADKRTGESWWSLHASGVIQAGNQDADPSRVDITGLQEEFIAEGSVEKYYRRFAHQGIAYGPNFQGIERLWHRDGEALGQLRLPEAPAGGTNGFMLHPVLLDAGFQLIMTLFPEDNADAYLVVGIKRLEIRRRPGNRVWGRANLPPANTAAPQTITASLTLFTETGQVAAQVEGLTGWRASRKALFKGTREEPNALLHEIVWRPQTVAGASEPPGTRGTKPEQWLIFADDRGVGGELSTLLNTYGQRSCLVFPGSSYRMGSGRCHIQPDDPADMSRLLGELESITGVIHLWSLDAGDGFDPLTSIAILQSVPRLVRLLGRRSESRAPRIWLVTRGAWTVGAESTPCRMAWTPMWGLGRVIALEHPELCCTCVDLDPSDSGIDPLNASARNLLVSLNTSNKENPSAWRDGVCYAPRLIRSNRSGKDIPGPFQVKTKEVGILENLILSPLTRTPPETGEVEIQVCATGLNFRDLLHALGMLKTDAKQHGGPSPGDLPFGLECAGKITALGEGVDDLMVGDEVIATPAVGSMASFTTVRREFVAPKPASLTLEEAATIPLVFLTAWYGFHHLAKLRPGDRVLIHAGAGGVGMAAIQLAQRVDAEVFATASPEKWAFLEKMGVRHIMNSRTLDFAAQILSATHGRGVDVVLNSLNGEFIDKSFDALARGGRFVEIGKIGIRDAKAVEASRPDVAYYAFDLGEVAREAPERIATMLEELMKAFREGSLEPLPRKVFPARDIAGAFRWMAQTKHIGKIVINGFETGTPKFEPAADGTYLISGGLGALGLLTAEWMVKWGVRHLVLTGRHAPGNQARKRIDKLKAAGTFVTIVQGDIASEREVKALVEKIQTSMPALKGVIHAAGVLDDGVIMEQTDERFAAVMAPKAVGAWNLHRFTLQAPLDFFVMFSSGASVLGNLGQSAYAAANGFLDGLAHYRRGMGLPATTINWGPWADVGMAASQRNRGARLLTKGVRGIAPENGLEILERLIRENRTQTCVLDVDWQKYKGTLSTDGDAGLFSELIEKDRPAALVTTEPRESEIVRQMEETLPEQRPEALLSAIRILAEEVMQCEQGDGIAVDRPLMDQGFDSLMAVEMRNKLSKVVGADLPVSLLFDYPTLEKIRDFLLTDVFSFEEIDTATVADVRDASDGASANLLEEIETLIASG